MDTLRPNEYHPAACLAMEYLQSLPAEELAKWREAFASTAMAGNRLAEICFGTIGRLLNEQPVSDRYLLGLAFFILRSSSRCQES
jgi:hypothetical protein